MSRIAPTLWSRLVRFAVHLGGASLGGEPFPGVNRGPIPSPGATPYVPASGADPHLGVTTVTPAGGW